MRCSPGDDFGGGALAGTTQWYLVDYTIRLAAKDFGDLNARVHLTQEKILPEPISSPSSGYMMPPPLATALRGDEDGEDPIDLRGLTVALKDQAVRRVYDQY